MLLLEPFKAIVLSVLDPQLDTRLLRQPISLRWGSYL